jgi:hypothetical protein
MKIITTNNIENNNLHNINKNSKVKMFILFYKMEIKNNISNIINNIKNNIDNNNYDNFIILYNKDTLADPFLFKYNDIIYLFYEKLNTDRKYRGYPGIGEIYYSILNYNNNNDEYSYSEPHVSLISKTHLSFPYIFENNNKIYMLPENSKSNKLSLYESNIFPSSWSDPINILNGSFVDSIIFEDNNIYYLFTTRKIDNIQCIEEIYWSYNILKDWKQHPHKFPISKLSKGKYRRNGGSIIKQDNIIYRFIQRNINYYAESLDIFIITINENEYIENKINIIENNIHHFNILDDWVTFDSHNKNNKFYN